MEGLTEGRIVHWVVPHGPSAGQHRPAIVVRVWRRDDGGVPLVQLQVFTDASNDGFTNAHWATSVHYDEAKGPGTWHWIERA